MDEGAYMRTQLEIAVSDHQPATVVVLAGELDIATGDMLRGAIRNLLRRGRTRLVVDTSDLEFCDSSGLEALLDSRDETETASGSLRLAGVHGVLELVLEVTRLRNEFLVDETSIESVTALVVDGTRDVSMV
ncbi:STAS domain-containing protein [Microbispora sp. NPDC049125]|uniref:STAS domain-containing protein n=1 Tax=Microbispora sp. NPDC049125 TaxID=3154929 RepID=UPI003466222D